MLRPHFLNKKSVGEKALFSPSGKTEYGVAINLRLPPLSSKEGDVGGNRWSNKKPIAIYPARTNPRIVGQLGTFTIHGVDKEPLNRFIESMPDSDRFLARIDLVDLDVEATKRTLWYLGLRQLVFYPDPDHLAKDVAYAYKY